MKKILIIEDDRALNKGITFNLKEEGFDVKGVYSLFEGRLEIEKDYDLIILDVNLPDGSGFDLCSEIRLKNKNTAIIFLSACDMEFDIVNGFKLGADDYITKPFSIRELMARVKALLRRSNVKKEENIIKFGDVVVNFKTREVTKGTQNVELTLKEFELLKLLIKNKGNILTRELLLDKIWGYEYIGETRTVDVHIRHLRKKIESDDKNPQYIQTIRGVGYKFTSNE